MRSKMNQLYVKLVDGSDRTTGTMFLLWFVVCEPSCVKLGTLDLL